MSDQAQTEETDLPPEMDPARIPRAGETVAGRYRIEALVGRGGMAAVLRAQRVSGGESGERVAIKWVLPGRGDAQRSRDRLLREARLAGRIEHPNVVRVLEVGEDLGSVFLVMELLSGDALSDCVHRGPYAPEVALAIMLPVLRAVAAAHEAGVVHRDLKPQNIILCPDGEGLRPTLFDFGISRSAPGSVGRTTERSLTQTGVMVGTPVYMAPEQLAGTQDADPRFDVYALGVMIYELLSADFPFESDMTQVLLTEKLNRDPIPISRRVSDLDAGLASVVMKALARDPDKRWPTVDALGRALAKHVDSLDYDGGGPSYFGPMSPRAVLPRVVSQPRQPRRGGRLKWAVAAGASVVLAAASVAIVAGAILSRADDANMQAVELEAPTGAAVDLTARSEAMDESLHVSAERDILDPPPDSVASTAGEPEATEASADVEPERGEPAETEPEEVEPGEAGADAAEDVATPARPVVRRRRIRPRRVRPRPRRSPSGAGQTGRLRVDEF